MSAAQPGRARRVAGWTALALLLALVIAVGVATSVGGSRAALSPDNPAPDGGRALARLLAGRGVQVRPTTALSGAADAGPGTTLLVVRPELLSADQTARLARTGADLVLLAPDATSLSVLAPDATSLSVLAPQLDPAGQARVAVRTPGCDLAAATAAGAVRTGGSLYTARSPFTVCYPEPGAAPAGSFAQGPGPFGAVTILGRPALLSNAELAAQGDAALALWSLGAHPVLVWYLPDPLDLARSGTARPVSPPAALAPLAVLAGFAVLVLLYWRGRRLGPLVAEDLPVSVRAAETVEGRARLYRQARARGRAAAVLRTATLRRAARAASVPGATDPAAACDLVADAAGLPASAVRDLVLGEPPRTDADLVRLAGRLDQLERAVRAGPDSPAAPVPTPTTHEGARR